MISPTNWPDPTRPGVPMFPERKAWHMLDRDVWEWCPSRQAWNDTVLHPSFVKAKDMAWREYHGPCLTPTQITEMLAAERERCAKICDEFTPDKASIADDAFLTGRYLALAGIAEKIRNLGDVP